MSWGRLSDGAIIVTAGLAAWLASSNLPTGSAMSIGPGMLPRILATGLLGLGIFILVADRYDQDAEIAPIDWRALVFTSLALASFGLSVDRFGLVIATVALVAVGGVASNEFRWREMPFLAGALAAFSAVVFVYFLMLPIPIWPR